MCTAGMKDLRMNAMPCWMLSHRHSTWSMMPTLPAAPAACSLPTAYTNRSACFLSCVFNGLILQWLLVVSGFGEDADICCYLCHGYMWNKIICKFSQPSSTSIWKKSYFTARKLARNYYKIISQTHRSSWIFSNTFTVAEIISELLQQLK